MPARRRFHGFEALCTSFVLGPSTEAAIGHALRCEQGNTGAPGAIRSSALSNTPPGNVDMFLWLGTCRRRIPIWKSFVEGEAGTDRRFREALTVHRIPTGSVLRASQSRHRARTASRPKQESLLQSGQHSGRCLLRPAPPARRTARRRQAASRSRHRLAGQHFRRRAQASAFHAHHRPAADVRPPRYPSRKPESNRPFRAWPSTILCFEFRPTSI